jgi:hypothetical protein
MAGQIQILTILRGWLEKRRNMDRPMLLHPAFVANHLFKNISANYSRFEAYLDIGNRIES